MESRLACEDPWLKWSPKLEFKDGKDCLPLASLIELNLKVGGAAKFGNRKKRHLDSRKRREREELDGSV